MPVPLLKNTQGVRNPFQIYGSDLVAYFRADVGVTLDGSNNVSDWTDITGNGHDFQQTAAANRPLYFSTGGPNNLPYIASGAGANTWMQHIGTPVTINTGNWSSFIIASCQVGGGLKVYTTTLTTPAGCVAFAWRKTATDKPEAQQIALSAPTALTSTMSGDMLPAPTWVCGLATMNSGGTRSLYSVGDHSQMLNTDTHTGNIGIQLGEGYLFRFGGTMYTNLAVHELGFVKRTSSSIDANAMKAYAASKGLTYQ